MAYLSRSERRTEVLDAVLRIVALDGFSAATVRRVSAAVDMSPGNIHHLFGSAAELKREAFNLFADREIAALDAGAEKPSLIEQLEAYLSMTAIGSDPASRQIWKSAGTEAASDPDFGPLWAEKARIWLNRISHLLTLLSEGALDTESAESAAWRLMAFSVGITSFAGAQGLGLDPANIQDHLRTLIRHELDTAAKRRPKAA